MPTVTDDNSALRASSNESERIHDVEQWPWLHLYPQYCHHSEAKIIGNAVALTALANALLEAVASGKAEAKATTSDGEGYGITVERTNYTGLRYTRLPYIADFALETEAQCAEQLRERLAALGNPPPLD